MNSLHRLLLVTSDSTKTGAPSQVLILARELKATYQVSVCCPQGWLADELTALEIKTHPWPTGPFHQQLKDLAALYNEVRPTVVHCHGSRAGIVGRLAERDRAKTKVVYTEHLWTKDYHLVNPLREKIQHHYLKQAATKGDWVVAVSKAVADFVIKKRQVSPKRLSVIYGAIEPISTTNITAGPKIGTLGQVSAVKDVPTILEAVKIIAKQFPNLKLVVGGDGPDLKDCQNLAERLDITEHCRWLGLVDNSADFFKQISIYVQASTSESFGLAVGEAMSCGRVVIVSNVGGLPELVTDGQSGLLFPAGDATKLAELITNVLTDHQLFIKLSQTGQARAKEFSVDRFITAHNQLYLKVTNEALV